MSMLALLEYILRYFIQHGKESTRVNEACLGCPQQHEDVCDMSKCKY